MKIESADYLEQLRSASKPRTSGASEGEPGFSKLLEAPEGTAAPARQLETAPAAPGGLLENSGLAGRILAGRGVAESAPVSADEQLEKALDKMESYAAALGDGRKNLKEIEPLADEMRKAAGQLAKLGQSLSPDHPLKNLANDAAVLATVEAMKFKRGDYV
ncbi:MAG: hypothetical protein LBS31_02645 [Candidatus Adiutrix sp.]|jgi:hypothetical protein|nr:hypothetical protein [Candidatus Adiutrix sp.]